MSTHTLNESEIHIYKTFDDMPIFESSSGMKLLDGIVNIAKFTIPSEIQQKAIVPLAQGHDMIAQAQSGTGKTGTFVTGSIARIKHSKKTPQVIVLAHTHELAEQIGMVYSEIGATCKTIPVVCVGGRRTAHDNMIDIGRGCHVIIATPGRLNDLIRRKAFKLSDIKTVILDEADKLLSKNFKAEVGNILQVIDSKQSEGNRLQIGIFSATFPEDTVKLAISCTQDPIYIHIPQEEISLKGIKQYKIEAGEDERIRNPFAFKGNLIIQINEVHTITQAIIYVNDSESCERLQAYLSRHGEMETTAIHGKLTSSERYRIIKDFRTGKIRVLISTDILARGIDFSNVMLVINFDLPRVLRKKFKDDVCRIVVDQERIAEYIHKIGRSGRFNRKGVALNFVTNNYEKTLLETIEDYYQVLCEDLPEELADIF